MTTPTDDGSVRAEATDPTTESAEGEAPVEPVEEKKPSSKKSSPKKRAATKKAAAPSGSELWKKVVGAFAKAVDLDFEDVSAFLANWLEGSGDEEVELLGDSEATPDQEICETLGISPRKPKVRGALKGLRKAVNPAVESAAPAAVSPPSGPTVHPGAVMAGVGFGGMGGMMPTVTMPEAPTDEWLMGKLRVGGVSKVDKATILLALQVAIAHQMGFFDVPGKILSLWNDVNDRLEEPASSKFYALHNMVTAEKYGEVLSLLRTEMEMESPERFINKSRQKELLERIPAAMKVVHDFHRQLMRWNEQWRETSPFPMGG